MDRCWATPQVDKDSDKWQVCRGKGRGWVEKRWKMDLARLGQVPPRNVNDGGEGRGRRKARRLERERMEETLCAEDAGVKEWQAGQARRTFGEGKGCEGAEADRGARGGEGGAHALTIIAGQGNLCDHP